MRTTFPEESVALAKEIATKYKKRGGSKRNIASQLYSGNFLEIHYGLSESLKTGKCGRYLHEIVKDAECFTMAGVLYLIARESGLNPRLYWAMGMKDVAEGSRSEDIGTADHAFIMVDIAKDKKWVLDTQMRVVGDAKIIPGKNIIQIRDRSNSKRITRHYEDLYEMSEKEYIEKVEKNRSPEGGRSILSSTQRVKAVKGMGAFLTYSPERKTLTSSFRQSKGKLYEEPFEKVGITEVETLVQEDGNFDFGRGNLRFFDVYASGWNQHEGPLAPLIYLVQDAKKLWQMFEKIMVASGRKSPVHLMNFFILGDKILKSGLHPDLSVCENSLAESVLKENDLEGLLLEIRSDQEKPIGEFIERCKQDERSYRCLLRNAQYVKRQNQVRSRENPSGFVFSREDHERLRRESFEKYVISANMLHKELLDWTAVELGVKKGSRDNSRRKYNILLEHVKREQEPAENIDYINRSSFRGSFNYLADEALFNAPIDVLRIPISDLGAGLSESDLIIGAQDKLFFRLLAAFNIRRGLFLASYKKGLQKVLNQKG